MAKKVERAGSRRRRTSAARPGFAQQSEMLKQGRTAELLELAERAAAADPEDPWPYDVRATVFERLKRYDDAVRCLRWLIARGHEYPAHHFSLGRLFVKMGDLRKAVRCYSEVIASKEPYVLSVAHYERAECYLKLREYRKAIRDCDGISPGWYGFRRTRDMVLEEARAGLGGRKAVAALNRSRVRGGVGVVCSLVGAPAGKRVLVMDDVISSTARFPQIWKATFSYTRKDVGRRDRVAPALAEKQLAEIGLALVQRLEAAVPDKPRRSRRATRKGR